MESNEIWKDIIGYEDKYEISSCGNVRNKKRKRLMKPNKHSCGYLTIHLYKYNKKSSYYIHRLVATHFITNPNNYNEVNHKDFNKRNNCIENLEFCTSSQNKKHLLNSHRGIEIKKKISESHSKRIKNKKEYYEKEICDLYKDGYSIKSISKKIELGRDNITDIIKENNLLRAKSEIQRIPIIQKDLKGNVLKEFVSYSEANRWLIENGYTKNNNVIGDIKKSIQRNGTSFGFKWCEKNE